MTVPDESGYIAPLDAWFHTGDAAVRAAEAMPPGVILAVDTETPGLTDSFTIKCVTAAWHAAGRTEAVLLDPAAHPVHHAVCADMLARAGYLVMHNSAFDVPGMVALGILPIDQLHRVVDTLIYARMAWPDTLTRKGLEVLADRLLGMRELRGAIDHAIAASGLRSRERWYRDGDIHMPLYRHGAMADTVVTLRVLPPLWEAAVARQLDHPFRRRACTDRSAAADLVEIPQRVNRVMLRRAARGLAVDLDYLDTYRDTVLVTKDQAVAELRAAGCRPGVGADLVKLLDAQGALPSDWPRTPTGRLKADKAALESLHHPLAVLHRTVAHTDKVLGYLEKVHERSRATGRLHPQFHILGASATGRMSVSEPELQQFPAEARPIVRCDGHGMHSVDWSQIEPRLLAWGARDEAFILPSEQGADLYEPISRLCGTARKDSKVVLLATMYGQGRRKLAASLGVSMERADYIRRQLRAAMPEASRFMGKLQNIGDQYGVICTMAGRILTVPEFNGAYAGYKAVNFYCQGSNADFIYHVILEAERRGIADEIMLPMHDEIVCDSRVAAEMEDIMQAAPPWLVQWAGRTPVIHTDSADMGNAWAKV